MSNSFYRTYEELKLPSEGYFERFVSGFYRTYEELKLGMHKEVHTAISLVFIVPMRN